jgi:hypothetical protein
MTHGGLASDRMAHGVPCYCLSTKRRLYPPRGKFSCLTDTREPPLMICTRLTSSRVLPIQQLKGFHSASIHGCKLIRLLRLYGQRIYLATKLVLRPSNRWSTQGMCCLPSVACLEPTLRRYRAGRFKLIAGDDGRLKFSKDIFQVCSEPWTAKPFDGCVRWICSIGSGEQT